ncbi:MAG: cytochrome c [Bacteroidia bacterium]|jgi:Zn-finger protein
MKKKIQIGFALVFAFTMLFSMHSCKTSSMVKEKSGAVLWSENCSRCHYAPDPEDYNDAQWEVINMHMQVRTSLTAEETEKITHFLQDSN